MLMDISHLRNSLLLFFLISILHCPPPVCGNAELRALMEIKASLDPDNKLLSSWSPNGDPCSGNFLGVFCNQHRKVGNISLQSKGLTGKLSPAIADLKCLSGLYLHYNSLSGEIPREIANLTELTDLYLDVNNFTGTIPPEIGSMASLQVLQLCCNNLTGRIPPEMGSLKKLTLLSLQKNALTGTIPTSLGDLGMLKRLYLSSNQLSGSIPDRLANLPSLEVVDVQNNSLSGVVPPALQRLKEGFHSDNNPGLCGTGFTSLRACTSWDNVNINQIDSSTITPSNIPQSANFPVPCRGSRCTKSSSRVPRVAIVCGVIGLTVSLLVVVFICIVRYRRGKQKISNRSDASEDRSSIDWQGKDFKRSPSPLVALEYSKSWDPANAAQDCDGSCHKFVKGYKFNLEEVESATHHFSEMNLLGKSKFSAVYKGILKDGSVVAIKTINKTSCKTEEDEFMKALSLLNSLKHDNLVNLKGFCCSKARGECFLVYDFASNGNLSQYLDVNDDDSSVILDWPTRASIVRGIAKGIEYLHSNDMNKPSIVHQNISVEKVVLDQQFRPLILDSGLLKLVADDVVYSALKVSAALGYMAPEYITTGRFTEKSDVYAFGVIILQVLSGKRLLSSSMRSAAESGNLVDFIDSRIQANFSGTEASRLTKIALDCTHECPENRPSIALVVEELSEH